MQLRPTTPELIQSLRSEMATRGAIPNLVFDPPAAPIQWHFGAGLPDPAFFPIDDLARIAEQVLRQDAVEGLQYGKADSGSILYGFEGLRQRIAERESVETGRVLGIDEVMLTSGGVQALTLAVQAFVDPGDVVAVEAPTWNLVLRAAQVAGAEAIPIPVDDDGFDVDALESTLERLAEEGRSLKLVYTISTFHTPTGVSLSSERRRRLVELAAKWRFVILEDDVYAALRYEGEALPSMLSMDEQGLVIRIQSLSKTLAPALRLGWVTGHAETISSLAAVRADLGVSQWVARIADEYIREGLYEPHIARVNALYRTKRDACLAALAKHCPDAVRSSHPKGGFFLWCELDPAYDGQVVHERALAAGVACRPGERFFGDPEEGRQCFRICFTTPPLEHIEPGIAALAEAIRASKRA